MLVKSNGDFLAKSCAPANCCLAKNSLVKSTPGFVISDSEKICPSFNRLMAHSSMQRGSERKRILPAAWRSLNRKKKVLTYLVNRVTFFPSSSFSSDRVFYFSILRLILTILAQSMYVWRQGRGREESVSASVFACVRERKCESVFVRESVKDGVCVRECVCVKGRENVREGVCDSERESVFVCVCVKERKREKAKKNLPTFIIEYLTQRSLVAWWTISKYIEWVEKGCVFIERDKKTFLTLQNIIYTFFGI